jgi:hypothetical protein
MNQNSVGFDENYLCKRKGIAARSGGIWLRNFVGMLAPLFPCYDTNKGKNFI